MKNKKTFSFVLIIVTTYILLLFGNYLAGTDRIVDAHEHQFRGGSCYACQSCNDQICESKSGFDVYYLYISLFVFTFIVGFVCVFLNYDLKTSLMLSIVSALAYFVATELLIKGLSIPVLYSHFTEGRQNLSTSAFTTFNVVYNIYSLLFSTVTSLAGLVIGFLFLLLKKVIGKVDSNFVYSGCQRLIQMKRDKY